MHILYFYLTCLEIHLIHWWNMTDLKFGKAEIILLSDKTLDFCSAFDCGDDGLNKFLLEDALDHLRGKIAVTYLFCIGAKTLGFFCLSMFAIKPTLDALRLLRERGKEYTLFPSLLISRFGVDKKYHRLGVGKEMIDAIIGIAFEESVKIGCRFIIVDAYRRSEPFYGKNGFSRLSKTSKNSNTVKLYLDLLREF